MAKRILKAGTYWARLKKGQRWGLVEVVGFVDEMGIASCGCFHRPWWADGFNVKTSNLLRDFPDAEFRRLTPPTD